MGLDARLGIEAPQALERIAQGHQVQIGDGSRAARASIPRLPLTPQGQQIEQQPVAGLLRRPRDSDVVVGLPVAQPQLMRAAGLRHDEHENASGGILGVQLLHPRRQRWAHLIAADREHLALDPLAVRAAHPDQLDPGEPRAISGLSGTTDHEPATQVGAVIGEGDQRLHDVLLVGDRLLPLDLLALSLCERLKIDPVAHSNLSLTQIRGPADPRYAIGDGRACFS
ncbi:MAG: hypothetical protein R3F43_30135, partial [bacterium]